MVLLLAALLALGLASSETVLLERAASGAPEERSLEDLRADWLGPDAALSIRFPQHSARGAFGRASATVRFVGGDRVTGRIVGGSGETLRLELAESVPLPVSIDDLASLVFSTRVPLGQALTPAETGDRLFWVRDTGLDTVDGTFEEFTDAGVRFFGRRLGAVKEFPWDEVAGLTLELFEDSSEAAGPTGDGAEDRSRHVAIDLDDGSRLRGELVELGRDGCALELQGGQLVVLPLEVIIEIALDDGRFAFLSDLEPASAPPSTPFGDDVGLLWTTRVDRGTSGGPLRARGTYYARGLGVHAPSVLSWELDGSWRELRGAAALDDEVATLPARGDASVEFRVWLDREPGDPAGPAWSSGVVHAGDPLSVLDGLSLEGVRRLTLQVDMADKLHMGDRADWLRMRLVR